MQLSRSHNGTSALDAIRSGLGVAPEMASRGPCGQGVTICLWRTPWLTSYEVEANDDLIVALHTAGTRSVRTRLRGRWSASGSNPGHVHVIPSGFPVAFKPEGQIGFATVHVAPERLSSLADEDEARVPFRFAFYDSFVATCIRALMDEMRAPRERGSLFVDSITNALLLHLARPRPALATPSRARAAIAPRALSRIRERIESSLESGVSLDELATEAGLSRFHFARAFRAAMEVPPHRYLTLRRIERAKDLLLQTELSLADVALAVGFSSQSHFTLRFREEVGETPRRFREQR